MNGRETKQTGWLAAAVKNEETVRRIRAQRAFEGTEKHCSGNWQWAVTTMRQVCDWAYRLCITESERESQEVESCDIYSKNKEKK